MDCPYCGIAFSIEGVSPDHCFPKFQGFTPFSAAPTKDEQDKQFSITSHKCPDCRRQIMWLNEIAVDFRADRIGEPRIASTTLLYPKHAIVRVPEGVPPAIAQGFREAVATLSISPKASAALSRRTLQTLIREVEGIVARNLYDEISELVARNRLPRSLADDVDAIRHIGNFAAHPIKSTSTGEITDVEPGEAEWIVQILTDLLKFYFVDEPRSEARRAALNQKLGDAGKGRILKS